MIKKQYLSFIAIITLSLYSICGCTQKVSESKTQPTSSNQTQPTQKTETQAALKTTTEPTQEIEEEIINPLTNKNYDTFDTEIDFTKFHDDFLNTYANYTNTLSDFMENHTSDLYKGKRFCDFNDYELTFSDIYAYMYKIINYDINQVPENYRNYWTALQEFAQYNIETADKMYRQSKNERTQTIDVFTDEAGEKIDNIENLLPINTITEGQTLITDKYEATLQQIEFSYDVEPPVKSTFYTHYPAESGKVYIHIDIDVKNLQQNNMNCDEVYQTKADYNNGYTYDGFSIVEDSDNDFTYSSITAITPLETKGIHALISCPEEVATSSNPLFINITFFDGAKYIYQIR